MNKVQLTYFVVSDNFLKAFLVKVVEKLDTLVFTANRMDLFEIPKVNLPGRGTQKHRSLPQLCLL